jgi:hypothetical protein
MNTNAMPRRSTFRTATIMSALWLGANTLLVWQAYGVETAAQPKPVTSFSYAEAHANAHLDNLPIL